MDTLLDILQAAGIGVAIGIRPFLPVLLVGALAAGDLGVDFDGTDWSFLEQPGFLVGALIATFVLSVVARRDAGAVDDTPLLYVIGLVAVVLAALEGAGSLDDRGGPVAAGLAVGAVGAVLGLMATRPVFVRVRSRLDAGAAALLPLYREGLALLVAALSVLFPPLALVAIGVLVWLLLGGRRREGEKYAGLRILR